MSYSQIAILLHDKYKITIGKVGIRDFMKRRAKKDSKICKFAWDAEFSAANNLPEPKAIEPPTMLKPPAIPEDDDDFEIPKFKDVMKYSDTYNLTLMSPEEAAALEERIRRKKERDKEKEKN